MKLSAEAAGHWLQMTPEETEEAVQRALVIGQFLEVQNQAIDKQLKERGM